MRRSGASGAVALAAVLLTTAAGAAQTVTTVGSSDVALDRRLDRLLQQNPIIISSDTVFEARDTILGPVLVLDATLILEGTILGDLVGVEGGLWVRDSAFVLGDVVNIGGGLYRDLARIGGTIMDLPDTRNYRVVRETNRIIIEASGTPSRVALDGPLGFRIPSYDRANGLTATWGAGYSLPIMGVITPTARGYAGWRTAVGEPVYGGSIEVRFGATILAGGYDRGWATRDAWIQGDLENSLNYLWDGSDARNYYGAERRWAGASREFGDEAKSFFAVLRVLGQIEDATSLDATGPWTIVNRTFRPNPDVDDSRIASASARFELEYHGQITDLVGHAEYEAAREQYRGEHRFDRVEGRLALAVSGPWDHTLEIEAFGQLPVSGDTLPRQRWSVVGGAGTLQTLPAGRYRGDRVLMVRSTYRIPAGGLLAFSILGPPELQLLHAMGLAWLADTEAPLIHELGAGIQFSGAFVRYMFQPDDPGTDRVLVGLSWPLRSGYRWQD